MYRVTAKTVAEKRTKRYIMLERFERFTSAISTATKCVVKLKAREVREKGLRATHVMTLVSIGKSGARGVTATTIGKYCREDKAGISKDLAALKEKGYIAPLDESKKKYGVRYVLTDVGEALYEKIRDDIREVVLRCGDGVDEAEREIFYRVFDKILDNLLSACEEIDADGAE